MERFLSSIFFGFVTILLLVSFIAVETNYVEAVEWKLVHVEYFNEPKTLVDQQPFGDIEWLIPRLRGGGNIVVDNGYAVISTPHFRDSALIMISESLPKEYLLRVKVGLVHYDYNLYTYDDFHSQDFKYKDPSIKFIDMRMNKLGWVENGFYWLALTDRTVEENSGEDWWHRFRKIVIDSDDHTNERHPVYMVYMNPDLDRSQGNWLHGMAHLLRCWSKNSWHTGKDVWLPAATYEDDKWYTVELEKYANRVVMRIFSEDGSLIEESDPVHVDLIYGMGKRASRFEYAYIGEPHIDSYKGYAAVDDIEFYLPK